MGDMTDEELLTLELREDRRLLELGLNPNESAPALYLKLTKMVEEIKLRERIEDEATRTPRPRSDQTE